MRITNYGSEGSVVDTIYKKSLFIPVKRQAGGADIFCIFVTILVQLRCFNRNTNYLLQLSNCTTFAGRNKIKKNMSILKSGKPVGLACDHAGYELKQVVMQELDAKGIAYKDFGTYSTDSCDYPDFAHPLALAVEQGECYPGIAICGSGNGINMTLNKHQGIRAALCWTEEIASLARQHNDANVLVMPGRFISAELGRRLVDIFLNTDFEGGRHQRRIDKIPVK